MHRRPVTAADTPFLSTQAAWGGPVGYASTCLDWPCHASGRPASPEMKNSPWIRRPSTSPVHPGATKSPKRRKGIASRATSPKTPSGRKGHKVTARRPQTTPIGPGIGSRRGPAGAARPATTPVKRWSGAELQGAWERMSREEQRPFLTRGRRDYPQSDALKGNLGVGASIGYLIFKREARMRGVLALSFFFFVSQPQFSLLS